VVTTLKSYVRIVCAWCHSWWAWLDNLRWIRRICAYWLGNKVDTQTFRVSCVCGTAGLAKSIGLGKVGQERRIWDWGKECYRPTLSFGLSKLGATSSSPCQTKVDETVLKYGKWLLCIFVWIVPCAEHWKVEGKNFWWPSDTPFNAGQIFSTHHDNPGRNDWRSFTAVVENFLRNLKALNYHDLSKQLLNSYKHLGCNMSVKVHFFS